MDFGAILKRTWDITWKFKGLWVLGILAGCSGRNGGGSGGNASNSVNYQGSGNSFPQLEHFINSIDPSIWIGLAVAIVLIVLLLVAVFIVVAILGQAGLIHGFDRADEGELVTLSSAFRGGLPYFWRLFGLQVLLFVLGIFTVGFVIAALVVIGIATLGIGLLCLIPLICLLVPVAVAVGAYLQLVQVAIVVEDNDIFGGFRRAWQAIKEQPGGFIVMTLILVLGGGIVGLLISLPLIALIIPVVTGLLVGTNTSMGVGIGAAVIGFFIYLPILILLNGILQTYIQGAWTITYRRIIDRPGAGELGGAS
ncbi:MAG: hypothetical protein WBR18_07635 [Anaerolineales bacterium]